MHAAGYALDPEFMEFSKDMDQATQEGLQSIVEKMCLRDKMVELNSTTLTVESEVVQERIGEAMVELSSYQEREGVFTKPYVIKTPKTMAPAAWWAMYGKHLPILSQIACRVLAQPVCASAAERNWSVYGAIKTSARGTMGHAVADKRVYCHEALHLKGKLQAAGYKQAVEKWDSDSDSDESDDEDLAL